MAAPAEQSTRVNPADRLANRVDGLRPRGGHERLPAWVGPLLSALSFWGAIVLPLCYLSLLIVGIEDTSGLLVFLGLFGLHVLTLVAGRSYRADARR